jgi:3-mercaptopyruvate sulfurtransferase SseA
VALLLRHKGVKHIRPLEGGLEAWRDLGYPLQTVELNANSEPNSKA